jgi:hypothetical protein
MGGRKKKVGNKKDFKLTNKGYVSRHVPGESRSWTINAVDSEVV